MKTMTILAGVSALALLTTAAHAANTMTAAPANAMTTSAKPMAAKPATAKAKGPATTAPKTVEGKECSAEADAKGLHGKARKEFRSSCKAKTKGAGAPASSAKTPNP